MNIVRLPACKLVGANNDVILDLKRAEVPLPDRCFVGLRFEKLARQKKLFGQLLIPLLAKIGGHDNQDAASPLRPLLGDHQPGFDGLAESDFIGEQRAFGQRRIEGEQGCVHLMGIQVHLRPATAPASFSKLSDEQRLVSSCAKYFAWKSVRFIYSNSNRTMELLVYYVGWRYYHLNFLVRSGRCAIVQSQIFGLVRIFIFTPNGDTVAKC